MASVVKYARTLAALLPGGQVWEKIKRHALWTGIAGEFARVEERVTDLSREMDPSQSTELLEDWERLVGLPDDTTPAGITLEERRASVVAKLSALGGLSRPYLEAIANKIQPGAKVFNVKPFRVGFSAAGDGLYNSHRLGRKFTIGDHVGQSLSEWAWTFYFVVEYSGTISESLRRTMLKYKPAHAAIFFKEV
jgi:uncharacterized protein YmfQ (DUF2313 family)